MRSRRERTSLKKNFLFTASPSSSILPKPCAATSCRTTAGSDGPRPPRAENGAGFDALHLLFHENPLKKNKKFFQHRTRAWAFFPFHESSAPAVPSCEMKRHECRHTLPALRQQGGKKGTDAFSHANPSVRGTAMLKSSTAAAERFLRHAGRTVRHDRLAAKSEKNIPAAAATDESGSSEKQSAGDTSRPFDVPVSRPYRTLLWAATADSPAFRQKKQAMPVIEQQRMSLGKNRRTPRRNLQHGVQTHCSRSPCAPS